MKIEIVEKKDFEVIGKVAMGKSDEHSKWVLPLWKTFNDNIKEIVNVIKIDNNGILAGLWGIMNDIDETFSPWSDMGKYMAGVEVIEGANTPNGWIKWYIDGGKFLKVKCNIQNYNEIFKKIINDYIPKNGYTVIGNVMEYYIPNSKDFYLFFKIENL